MARNFKGYLVEYEGPEREAEKQRRSAAAYTEYSSAYEAARQRAQKAGVVDPGGDIGDIIARRTPEERAAMIRRYGEGYVESPNIESIKGEQYGDLLSELLSRRKKFSDVNLELHSPELQNTTDPNLLGRRRLLEEYARSFEPGHEGDQPGTTEEGARKLQGLAGLQRKGRLSRLQSTEETLRGQLAEQKTGIDNSIDNQLDRLIVNAGILANEQRQQTGAQYAERGLGRSTFANKAIEQDTLGELQSKAGARSAAYQAKLENKIGYETTLKNIQFEKERTKAAIDSENESDFTERLRMIQQTDLKNIYAQIDANAKLGAQDKQFTMETIGDIAQAAGTIGTVAAFALK